MPSNAVCDVAIVDSVGDMTTPTILDILGLLSTAQKPKTVMIVDW